MHFEAYKYSKSYWVPKLIRENKSDIVYGYTKYRSKKRCQEWCDAMNDAAMQGREDNARF